MQAHLEPLASILRVYGDGQTFENHEQYEWCCTVRWHDGGKTAELCGVDKPVTLAIWRACKQLAREIGVTEFRFERACGARPGLHEKRIGE